MTAIAALPEVEEVMLVTGSVDLLVRTRIRDLLINGVWQIEGIQRTETSLSIAEMKPKNTAADLITEMIARTESR
jgi:DNA-binding Lrp family transcriptional regulator